MYFDFEDYRPDITPVGRVISWREGVLLSVIVHLVGVIFLIMSPRWFPYDPKAAQAMAEALERQRPPQEQTRFVFVQPREDRKAPAPKPRAEASDQDRVARTVERPKKPANEMPFSRGNSSERVERMENEVARGEGPGQEPQVEQQANGETQPENELQVPESQARLQLPQPSDRVATMQGRRSGGSLGDALQNLQKYVQNDQFDNAQGGGGTFGPAIQFDTKGVEFGPWIRRFVAQVRRNWLIPYAAMSMQGHVVITFNVHKDGALTDLSVVGPCQIEAFNNAAYGALAASNPTAPLPPEYPADKAFFTVTFFYNEQPPQ